MAKGHSEVSKEGTHRCPSCRKQLPVTKYPTKRNAEGEYVRALDECRTCRDARRQARSDEKAQQAKGAA